MDLKTFLESASADHLTAQSEARAYTVERGEPITSNVMTMLLISTGLYGYISDTAKDKAHPARDISLALTDRIKTQSVFDLLAGTPKGDANLQMLDALIYQLMTEKAAELTQLKAAAIIEASDSYKPFERVTLHDVLLARDACPVVPVTQSNGYVVITTTADVEQHNPRLLADNPRTEKKTFINGFSSVSKAGAYECTVPAQWQGMTLFADDAYGVVGVA